MTFTHLPSLNLSITIDENISSVLTERIAVGINRIKKLNNAMTCKLL